jgi:hypothetical protein
MTVMTEQVRWKVYLASQTDGFGYERLRYGVREEYEDGATRAIHNQVFESEEEAQALANRFNGNVRKGMKYDNTMKTWR